VTSAPPELAAAARGEGGGGGEAAAPPRRHHGAMQGIDALPVGHVEHDADDRRLRAAMQAEDVVVGTGAPEQPRPLACRDRPQAPDALVEPRGLVEIGGDEFDAAHAADDTLRHYRLQSLSIYGVNP